MLLDLDPVAFQLGPLAIRWYGLLMAASVVAGILFMVRGAKKQGADPDRLVSVAIWVIVGGIVGARLVFVATNWGIFSSQPWDIVRLDHGGLAFHGALLGGLAVGLFLLRKQVSLFLLGSDLAVPGLCLGYALVRIANIFNGEILGRTSYALPFLRHPAQIYGVLIGIVLLADYFREAGRSHPAGVLFWSFILKYSVLRAVIEETFRDNPLYWPVFTSEAYGIGLFTLTQLATPMVMGVAFAAIHLIRRANVEQVRKTLQ